MNSSKMGRLYNYNDYEYYGELDYSNKPVGFGIMGKKYSGAVKVSSLFEAGKMNGFSMEKDTSRQSCLGLYKNDIINGPYIEFVPGDLKFGMKYLGKPNPNIIYVFSATSFMISIFENGESTGKAINYKNGVLSYDLYKYGSNIKSVVIERNLDFSNNYPLNRMELKPYKSKEYYSYNDKDIVYVRQGDKKYDTDGYGFIVWKDDLSSCVTEFVDDERTGFGCYNFQNGDVFCGQFYSNKVSGFGFYAKNQPFIISFGMFNNEKKKNGVCFEIEGTKLYIRKYSNNIKIGDSIEICLRTHNVKYYSTSVSVRSYEINNLL